MGEFGRCLRHLSRRPDAVGAIDMGVGEAREERERSQHDGAEYRSPVVPARRRSWRSGSGEFLVGDAGCLLLALERDGGHYSGNGHLCCEREREK